MSSSLFEEKLGARTKKSRSLYEKAKQVLPGGVAGNGKFMLPHPLYFNSCCPTRCTFVKHKGPRS
jgi:glutamate-1-semialdehyde aminotransferase